MRYSIAVIYTGQKPVSDLNLVQGSIILKAEIDACNGTVAEQKARDLLGQDMRDLETMVMKSII